MYMETDSDSDSDSNQREDDADGAAIHSEEAFCQRAGRGQTIRWLSAACTCSWLCWARLCSLGCVAGACRKQCRCDALLGQRRRIDQRRSLTTTPVPHHPLNTGTKQKQQHLSSNRASSSIIVRPSPAPCGSRQVRGSFSYPPFNRLVDLDMHRDRSIDWRLTF